MKIILRSIIFLLGITRLSTAFSGTFTATYLGGGIWEQDGGNWSTTAYPNNGHFVVIDGTAVPDNAPLYNVVLNIATPCALDTGVTVQSLTVANGSTLNLSDTANANTNGLLVNNGLITLNAVANRSQLRAGPGSNVGSTGVIQMSDSGVNYISGIADGYTLTIAAGGIIRGAGQLNLGFFGGLEHLLNFVNHGLIEATQPNNFLQIGIQNDNNTNSNLTNDAILRASSNAILRLRTFGGSATVFNAGGTISAIDNGKVRIGANVTVTGGTLVTASNGTIGGDGPGGGGGVLQDITNTGLVAIADQESIAFAGTFTNNGSVTLNSIGNGATLRFANGTTLAGTGAVTLSNNGSNYFTAVGFGDTLTIALSATIQGAGSISPGFSGGSNMLKITNKGLIHANISGAALTIRAEEFNGTPFTNSGTLLASSGATLSFNGTSTLTNSGGTLHVLPTSTISASGGITLLQTAGTIDLDGGEMNFPLGLDLNGGQLIGNGTFTGPIRNNGGIVGPGHSPGQITLTGPYTQGPNGTLEMEIGGTKAGTGYDQLVVSGIATLGGTLNVTAINGFQPTVGDVYTLITAGSFSGSFATININGFTGKIDSSSNGITLTITGAAAQLLNISTRLKITTGDNVLIGGFIITGTAPKEVIVRAIGPSLGAFGIANPLGDPTLELHASDGTVISNDNWKETQQVEIEAAGFAPGNDLESAILVTLDPGAYTAIVRGANDGTGVGLVEAYDLAPTAGTLVNISTRGFVNTGDGVMIGGFIVGGGGASEATVLARGIGPSLTDFGVAGALQNPTLELHNGDGDIVAENDDWKDTQQTEIEATGLPPGDDRESAILSTLSPGAYTAILRGALDTTGVGLVEVYHSQ